MQASFNDPPASVRHTIQFSNYRLPRFPIGRPVIAPGAQAALDATGAEGVLLLARHIHGDWGNLSAEDLASNELAVLTGKRLLSSDSLSKVKGGSGSSRRQIDP